MKQTYFRPLCVLVSIVLLLSLLPGVAFAELSGVTGVVPTDEYTFFEFEELKDMLCDEAAVENAMICIYVGFEDFTIEEDITVPENVTLKTDGAGIRIPAGVTLTLEGKMANSQLQVDGKLKNLGRLEMDLGDGGSLRLASEDSYTDRSGDHAGALYIPVTGSQLPEGWLVGMDADAFHKETVSEEDKTFWKLTIHQSEIPDPDPQPDPDPKPEKIEVTPMYRLYNPNSGEHFYTGSVEERENLVAAGWNYEGIAWNAPTKEGAPVYRLFNPNSGDHHYTMSGEERDNLVAVGWQYEGVAWNSASSSHVPQYRLYNPNADCGSHHYTGSVEERDYLVSLGWHYEGIGWFGIA